MLKAQGPDAYLLQHSQASEAIMRALAEHFGEDADFWGITGLLHDLDFPHTKDDMAEHGLKAAEIAPDLPADMLYAIAAHNSESTGKEPKSRLDKALRCAESVTGLVSAAALVRPDGMAGMQASSLKKKMKDKSFAAAVNRERIRECERVDLELGQFLDIAIKAMTPS